MIRWEVYHEKYIFRKIINRINRIRLRNRDFSLFASNCNACMILHELEMRFNSQFVNLWKTFYDGFNYVSWFN